MSAHAAAASRALRSTAPHAGLTELCGGPFICGGNLEQFSLLRAESFWPACARSACCARIVAGRELLQLLQRAHALPRHRHGVYLRTTSRVTFTTIANLALCTAVAQAAYTHRSMNTTTTQAHTLQTQKYEHNNYTSTRSLIRSGPTQMGGRTDS